MAEEEDCPRGFVPMREHLRAIAKIESLKRQIAELERLNKRDAAEWRRASAELRLSEAQSKIVLLALNGQPLSPERAAIGTQSKTDDPARVLTVNIHQIRKRLAANGCPEPFENVWGVGYRMTDAAIAWVKARLQEQQPGRAPA